MSPISILILMRRLLALAAMAFAGSAAGASWIEVPIEIIGPASVDIFESAQEEVSRHNHEGILITLDTPGGQLESTRQMVKLILDSPVPVVVWVGPAGARAGSAGAFITIAAHVASMAPGTNIGAAHPIGAGGEDLGDNEASKKVVNDAAAFIQSVAKLRGRDEATAISFVTTSLSITAEDALKRNVIDVTAKSPEELFQKINGRTVQTTGEKTHTLHTANATIVTFNPSLRQMLLALISNPNIFYLLFIAGLVGVGFELTHPGTMVPGVLGGISLILALIASSVLPVNFGAMLLLVASIGFLIAEAFLPSFGILGIGGFIGFIMGSLLLIDPSSSEGMRVSLFTIGPTAVAVAIFGIGVSYLVVKVRRSKVMTGGEGMVGLRGDVIKAFSEGSGKVRVQGEIWESRTVDNSNPPRDASVVVVDMDGLTLLVKQV